jgi:uncharacterized protein HemX
MMNENENERMNETEKALANPGRSTLPLWVAAIVILCLAAVAVGFIVDQHKIANQLSARNQELTASLTQTKGQLETLGSQLDTLKNQEAAREQATLEQQHRATVARARYLRRHAVKKDDPRWKQVEAELAEH